MKQTILVVIILMFTFYASAEDFCNPAVLQIPRAVRALDQLRTIAGFHIGNECQVSINVCSGSNSSADSATLVGEILIVTNSGAQLYMPIQFMPSQSMLSRYSILNGSRMFHYEYEDHNIDHKNGSYERFLFEAVKTPDLSRLEYIEFGVQSHGSKQLQWCTCHFVQPKPKEPASASDLKRNIGTG